MDCRLKIENMNLKTNSNCSPCWHEEAPSGAACPCHSSLREVDLLSLGKGQECRANTNGHRSWSDVFSWKRMCWTGKHYCSVCSQQRDYSVYMYISIHTLYTPLLIPSKGPICMGRTLFPSMVSIALPWTNIKKRCLNNFTFVFFFSNKEVNKNNTR
jgi:hypothetical protein